MFHNQHFCIPNEYTNATALFEEMNHLRRLWGEFAPPPPLKRSDSLLLTSIYHLSVHQPEKPVTVSQLAHMMHQSTPGVSQKVTVLEELGYVTRVAQKTDRRVSYIQLTQSGTQTATLATKIFFGRLEQALQGLGQEKTLQLLSLLQDLRASVESVQNGENTTKEGNCT